MTPSDKSLLLGYLRNKQPFRAYNSLRYSTLISALKECRYFSKRDIHTGIYNPIKRCGNPGNWLAAMGYFSILDQIGSCYYIGNSSRANNSISSAIQNFGFEALDFNQNKLDALIALRNAFIHDFNLLNIPYNRHNLSQHHKFSVLVDTANNWIVRLSQQQWDGNIPGKDFNNHMQSTFINLYGFGTLVESIHNRVYSLIESDEIQLKIPVRELINKYTFVNG